MEIVVYMKRNSVHPWAGVMEIVVLAAIEGLCVRGGRLMGTEEAYLALEEG